MTSLEPPPWRRRERTLGWIVAVVGVAVLVLSIVALVDALHQNSSDVGSRTVILPSDSTSASTSTSATPSPSVSASTGSSAASTSPTSTPTSRATSTSAVGKLPLVVLNNTTRTGLAESAAATFTRGGWTVTDTANLTQDVLSTCAYYDPSVTGAEAAAKALMAQFPAIKRVKVKFGALPSGPIVVVLTSDYTAQ